jgi:hypothetical protein
MSHITIERARLEQWLKAVDMFAGEDRQKALHEAGKEMLQALAICEQARSAPTVQDIDARVDAVIAKIKTGINEKPTALNSYGLKMWDSVRDDLVALATPPATLVQEPVKGQPSDADLRKAFTKEIGGPNPFYRCNTCGSSEPGLREYLVAHWLTHTTPSVEEPIGEIRNGKAYFYDGMYTNKTEAADGTKLYTTPPAPAPVPLTDEQIDALWEPAYRSVSRGGVFTPSSTEGKRAFARAIEAAHGITEKGQP